MCLLMLELRSGCCIVGLVMGFIEFGLFGWLVSIYDVFP